MIAGQDVSWGYEGHCNREEYQFPLLLTYCTGLWVRCKTLLLLVLALLTPYCECLSQAILSGGSITLAPGEFSRRSVDYFPPGESGPNCLWDFSDLEVAETPQAIIQSVDSTGQLVVVDGRQITRYQMRGGCLMETSREMPLRAMSYSKPPCGLILPVSLNDSVSRDFEGYGVYCGDHYYKEVGVSSMVVDGMGDILLSEADTIKNVCRVYKLKSYFTAMDMDASKLDSAHLKQVIEERYEWYISGYGRPIFETVTSTSYANLSPIGTTQYAYCSLPDYLLSNSDDTGGQRTGKDGSQGHGDGGDDNDSLHNSDQSIIHYMVTIDASRVTVDYSLDAQANISMLIASNAGMTYFTRRYTQEAGTGYQTTFDTGGLRPGIYILYINVDGKVYHEQIRKP